MRKTRKVLAAILVMALVMTLMPGAVLAETDTAALQIQQDLEEPVYDASIIYGKKADGTATLIKISAGVNNHEVAAKIAEIEESGITFKRIGTGFLSEADITEFTIPSSVDTYVVNADGGPFYGANISRVVFENGTTVIPANALLNGASLLSIVIPDSVTTIGETAFGSCTSLNDITFGSNTPPATIGADAFSNLSSGGGTVRYPDKSAEDYQDALADTPLNEWTIALTDTGPAGLTAVTAERPSAANATVKFISDEAGGYYYEVLESGAETPTIDTSGAGTVCDTTEQTIYLTNLTPGAKDIYIVVNDTAGDALSVPLKMTIPTEFVPVTGITVVPTTATAGTPLTLAGRVEPANATNDAIVWSMTNVGSTGATIENGATLHTTAAGTVIVTATIANGAAVGTPYAQNFTITVSEPPPTVISVTGVTLNKPTLILTVSGSETLIATVIPHDATNTNRTWNSNAPSIADVDTSGKVTAVAAGTATITVTTVDGNKTATCLVTVNANTDGGGDDGGGSSPTPVAPEPEPTPDLPITTPPGAAPIRGDDGSITLPGGGTIVIPGGGGNVTINLPPGTVIAPGGTISFPPGGGGAEAITDSGYHFQIRPEVVLILDEKLPLGFAFIIANPFVDVRVSDWFYADVLFAYAHGLLVGTSTEPMLFAPNGDMTRAMLATVLYRLSGSPDVSALPHPFRDVPENSWYSDAVKWAAANDLTSGVGDSLYAPEAPISRQDFAVILARYMALREINFALTQEYVFFADEAEIADYAKNAVQTLYKLKVLNGSGENLIDPAGATSRAEAAAMLTRFILQSQR